MKSRLALLSILALLVGAAPAEAPAARCTCMSPKRPTCEVWWQTAAIFVGRVIDIDRVTEDLEDGGEKESKIVTLRIQERLRGLEREREVEVRTGAGGGDCGFDFQRNEVYLVYANESARTGRLETGICSRTAPAEEAAADLDYLRSRDDVEPLISLYGMVYRERQSVPFGEDLEGPLDPGGPLPDVEVVLEGDDTTWTTRSDDAGWYELERIPAGRYTIRLRDITAIGTDDTWRFRLPFAPACVWRNVIVDPLPIDSRPAPR